MISGRSVSSTFSRAAQAQHREHGLDADQLQRDVGHGRDDAGDGDGEGQRPAAVPAAHEVRRGDVAVPVRDRPQPAHQQEHDRVQHDRVRHREETAHRSGGPHRGRNGDERVGGVEVAAEQEPGDPGPEAAAAEAPLVQAVQPCRLFPAPPRGKEPQDRDEDEEDDHDGECNAADGPVRNGQRHGGRAHRSSPAPVMPRTASRRRRSSLLTSRYEIPTRPAVIGTHSIWYQ